MQVRITGTARKHKIGNAHIRAAMINAGEPSVEGDALVHVGTDDRGVELELTAVPDNKREGLAVIHAMPLKFRRKS